jgi:glutamate-ammonia-ligase adenylyltransferase
MQFQGPSEGDSTSAQTSARRDAPARALITEHSPFLTRLIAREPDTFALWQQHDANAAWQALLADMQAPPDDLMAFLRRRKARAALTTALADLSGEWPLAQVTRVLSDFAERCIQIALRALLSTATARGEITPADATTPELGSGIIVLGMGKLGGFELNYSSDIDLIILFDKDTVPYHGPRNVQIFMNKLAADLTSLLQDRTSDGYVFRTDLRLRPDPMSTPLAVSTTAALGYYETVGQNWERAALIKARPVAGDMQAAKLFLRELVPFIWRKTLDFATIADIHSIKRQMNAGQKTIALPGHNIKTGMGGIREIEFYAATLQLVWGGRMPGLRVRGTLEALDALTQADLVSPEINARLHAHYHYLRTLEHRLQMRDDEQTHTLPERLNGIAAFMEAPDFAERTLQVLQDVRQIYTDSMMDTKPLAVDGNLVFTGVEADPDTLQTLARLGYQQPQRISDIIQGWHRGHRRSTRSKRSRQVLTELVPALLIALGETANPDTAFFHFDAFIDRIPSGAQIFSLLLARPELLDLLADILGSAPALGEVLSNDPALLDAVLEPDFFTPLPEKIDLQTLLTERLRYTHTYEQKMGYLRTFNNEKRFQAGVHLLKHIATPKRVGSFLSDLAEAIMQSTMQEVWAEYAQREALQGVAFAVLGLGKLGARGMTFGSDLDLVFLYDDGDDVAGEARMHLHRISQRLISALTLLTREGRLYEVDTRLRPGGSDGPLATHLDAFDQYFEKTAWTYEHMALVKARVAATNDPLFAERVMAVVGRHVLKPRDPEKLRHDVVDMRGRIAQQYPTQNPWALKHIRGGLVDLDFIAQYLVLKYGHAHPTLWHRSARRVYERAASLHLMDGTCAQQLIEAKKFLSDLLSLERLSAPGGTVTDAAPIGLKRLLAEGMKAADFEQLLSQVLAMEENVRHGFAAMEQQQF